MGWVAKTSYMLGRILSQFQMDLHPWIEATLQQQKFALKRHLPHFPISTIVQPVCFLNENISVIFPEWMCCNRKVIIIKVMGKPRQSRWWHRHTFWQFLYTLLQSKSIHTFNAIDIRKCSHSMRKQIQGNETPAAVNIRYRTIGVEIHSYRSDACIPQRCNGWKILWCVRFCMRNTYSLGLP